MKASFSILLSTIFLATGLAAEEKPELKIEISVLAEGNLDWDMTQARTAFVPGDSPLATTTMSKTARVGAHGYHDVFLSISRDRGRTWTEPEAIPSLKRFREKDTDYEVVAGDLWPKHHAKTGTILATGKTFNFEGGTKENTLREKISYAVLDPKTLTCGPLGIVDLPATDRAGDHFIAPNAGCHQWVELANGDVLLPVRYQKSAKPRNYVSTVIRCQFDGERLTFLKQGSIHRLETKRGLYEPSLTRFGDEFFLTLRADDGAWIAKSSDGLVFSEQIPWTFDDGELLGSYNTQQHFAEIDDRLYLIYTRKGANNDHIMRHRAPLFIGEIDPEKLCVIRATEQVLVPENDATLGNSGVCQVSPNEAWVTVAEGRVALSEKRPGDHNRVFLTRITATETKKP